MIYLASPYSNSDPQVRQARFHAACRTAARLLRSGHPVFSPIAYGHPLAEYGVPADWDFWEAFDRRMLDRCDEVVVLKLPGWQESRGVQAEIRIAAELGKPLRYLEPLATVSPTLAALAKETEA